MAEETQGRRSRTRVVKTASNRNVRVTDSEGIQASSKLTDNELKARSFRKYATTSFGFNSRSAYDAYGSGGFAMSQYGNFYSPQLSTDFLEKPQNRRERHAWYRLFYNSNEYVGAAVDLHSTMPLSKIRLEKPKGKNKEQIDYMYDFFVEMCDEMKLFKTLIEISHEYHLLGNSYMFAEEHDPYKSDNPDYVAEMREKGRLESERLFKEFGVVDRDPNYKGWKRIIILPPDQVIVKRQVMSDDSYIEFIPDPDTRKAILNSRDEPDIFQQQGREPAPPPPDVPDSIANALRDNGAIPLDTDPYSGSHVYHLCRKKCQYETYGVSVLERCINTLLFWDKLRQAQTSIASRHMTPFRIVWAANLAEHDVEDLRAQVDLALVDPDYSIITNYEVHWDEQGSNGRLLSLTAEYEQCENALFAGLGVTREMLTGESTYQGNRLTLEILNKQYLLFREMLQEYVENYLFKPVAKKKGFVEKDKYGRERLLYPHLSFTRLAIRDNDTFFDQAMQLFNKGSVPVDIILEMLNIDPDSARSKIEADMFTSNDPSFNQFMVGLYQAAANKMAETHNVTERLADYLSLQAVPQPPGGAEGAPPGGPMGRFSSTGLSPERQAALNKIVRTLASNPAKLDELTKRMQRTQIKKNKGEGNAS
jgi:hypothetical protein